MKVLSLIAITLLAACGGSTDTAATRYNFAVVGGRNQSSVAGTAVLANRITSQLTLDPQGKFATRVFDFLAPKMAYAQDGLPLPGDPVEGAIVCGRVAPIGEPQVVPLCAFTLADGKAANVVQPGTKAGSFNVVFSAQVPSNEPVKDSTTVTVQSGPADPNLHIGGQDMVATIDTVPANAIRDVYGNSVPFAIQSDSRITVVGTVAGTIDARRFTYNAPTATVLNSFTPIVDGAGKKIATLDYSLYGPSAGGGWTWQTWGTALKP